MGWVRNIYRLQTVREINNTGYGDKMEESVMVSRMHNNAIDINNIGRGYNHREHRGTQRVVIFIFRTLCVLCGSQNLISKISKSLRGFGHRNAR
jgi:hypothetical protein